ncbi:Nucleoside diphosphate kinase B [Fukomys damarensis]|uniref:Nucleoside diphosphate kinase n=1 Tax=Fukomys damarensis TaxID=885580 RepID=A0A091DWX6_FUKDA|nr:Nucleoside diphosphate kinase B [Fukomys damarensis]
MLQNEVEGCSARMGAGDIGSVSRAQKLAESQIAGIPRLPACGRSLQGSGSNLYTVIHAGEIHGLNAPEPAAQDSRTRAGGGDSLRAAGPDLRGPSLARGASRWNWWQQGSQPLWGLVGASSVPRQGQRQEQVAAEDVLERGLEQGRARGRLGTSPALKRRRWGPSSRGVKDKDARVPSPGGNSWGGQITPSQRLRQPAEERAKLTANQEQVWEGLNVVKTGRVMLGETNPADSKPGTIRGDFCIQVGRNIIHGSDSVKSAEKEISLWFKPEELVDYKSCAHSWIYE